jgi:hypothetical protein
VGLTKGKKKEKNWFEQKKTRQTSVLPQKF